MKALRTRNLWGIIVEGQRQYVIRSDKKYLFNISIQPEKCSRTFLSLFCKITFFNIIHVQTPAERSTVESLLPEAELYCVNFGEDLQCKDLIFFSVVVLVDLKEYYTT